MRNHSVYVHICWVVTKCNHWLALNMGLWSYTKYRLNYIIVVCEHIRDRIYCAMYANCSVGIDSSVFQMMKTIANHLPCVRMAIDCTIRFSVRLIIIIIYQRPTEVERHRNSSEFQQQNMKWADDAGSKHMHCFRWPYATYTIQITSRSNY